MEGEESVILFFSSGPVLHLLKDFLFIKTHDLLILLLRTTTSLYLRHMSFNLQLSEVWIFKKY